jgi:hypothetical protein
MVTSIMEQRCIIFIPDVSYSHHAFHNFHVLLLSMSFGIFNFSIHMHFHHEQENDDPHPFIRGSVGIACSSEWTRKASAWPMPWAGDKIQVNSKEVRVPLMHSPTPLYNYFSLFIGHCWPSLCKDLWLGLTRRRNPAVLSVACYIY